MSYLVPDGVAVHVRAIPIALWSSEFTPGTFPDDRAAQVRFKCAFRPVAGAYVACVRIADTTASLPVSAWKLRCGRTNDFGWVLRRERAALGAEGDVPRSGWQKTALPPGGVADPLAIPADAGVAAYPDTTDAMDAGVPAVQDLSTFAPEDAAMLELDSSDANAEAVSVLPNEQYRIVWCYREQLFFRFLEKYRRDPLAALDEYQAATYVVEPFRAKAAVSQLRELSAHEQAFVARVTAGGPEGYHGGWPSLNGMSAAIFDGTPGELRQLYLCEWLHWTCLHMVHNDPHWPYLLALRSVIRAAKSGAPIPDLAKEMPNGIVGMRAAQMRGYLLNLAWSGWTGRRQVQEVIDVWGDSRTHAHWRAVAEGLDERYGLRHPLRMEPPPPADEFRFTESERNALVAYFDMYALGVRRADDLDALDAHWQHVQQALGWLQKRQAALLASIDHVALMRAVGLTTRPGQTDESIRIQDRFHRLAAIHQVRFWEHASVKLGNQSAWDAHKPFVAWMAEGSDKLGKAFEGLVERYLAVYKNLSARSLEEAVQYLYRYHLALRNKGYEQSLPQHDVIVRLEPDLRQGKAVAKLLKRGEQTVLVEMELLTRVAPMPAGENHAPLRASEPGTGIKRYRRAVAQGEVREFIAPKQARVRVFDADSPALESFPKALANAATLIKVGIAAGELTSAMLEKDLRDINAELYLNMTQETLAALEPGSSLIAPVLQKLGPKGAQLAGGLVVGAKALGKAAGPLEGVRNVLAGGTTIATLFAPDKYETDLARYLDRGDGLPAFLEATKGVIQMASGGGALGALVIGAGTTVATISLGAWVGLGLLAISMLDVLIYLDTGGESPTQAFEAKVREARRAQFVLQSDSIPKPADKVTVLTPGGAVKQRASCLLARRLGLVHHIVGA